MGVATFLVGAALVGAPADIAFVDRFQTIAEEVRLGDIAKLDALPPALAKMAQNLVLVSSPKWHDQRVVSRNDLASRARALMPALGPWFSVQQTGVVLIARGRAPLLTLRVLRSDGKAIAKGDHLQAQLHSGIFTIERDVTALQPARTGEGFFARTTNGDVLSVRFGGEE